MVVRVCAYISARMRDSAGVCAFVWARVRAFAHKCAFACVCVCVCVCVHARLQCAGVVGVPACTCAGASVRAFFGVRNNARSQTTGKIIKIANNVINNRDKCKRVFCA